MSNPKEHPHPRRPTITYHTCDINQFAVENLIWLQTCCSPLVFNTYIAVTASHLSTLQLVFPVAKSHDPRQPHQPNNRPDQITEIQGPKPNHVESAALADPSFLSYLQPLCLDYARSRWLDQKEMPGN